MEKEPDGEDTAVTGSAEAGPTSTEPTDAGMIVTETLSSAENGRMNRDSLKKKIET